MSDAYLKRLIADMDDQVSAAQSPAEPMFDTTAFTSLTHSSLSSPAPSLRQSGNTRGVQLDRRRFGDDSDSDIDLDGL